MITPGQLVRQLLGPELFKPVGRAYRAFFVDLERVAACFPQLPPSARVLEVGGGDGQLLNALLTRFSDASATMIDIASQLGSALLPELERRVERMPNTSIAQYAALGRPLPDLISVCDVVHHIPVSMRDGFFADLGPLIGPSTMLVVKDIRPMTIRGTLSYLADRYISGDQGVSLIGEDELEALVKRAIPGLRAERTRLYDLDGPNYSIVFRRAE